MANLVRLLLDKDSGDIVAKEQTVPIGTFETAGFRFTQETPDTMWNISHAGGSNIVVVQVYNETSDLIIPDNVRIIDAFNIQITFASPQAGTANIVMVLT